ncbi:hypothetical protein N656DRAFT_387646 [Canariomyces notabilis]|uniref:Uncharacterized protein n=1 Tax=Canariomyces notabilis TaxID=2074819 RepID=A0AAN6TJF9_9PEZI|nr:hypothetical protein N656DRAFT_387646 [Canariomyces arenarius]
MFRIPEKRAKPRASRTSESLKAAVRCHPTEATTGRLTLLFVLTSSSDSALARWVVRSLRSILTYVLAVEIPTLPSPTWSLPLGLGSRAGGSGRQKDGYTRCVQPHSGHTMDNITVVGPEARADID